MAAKRQLLLELLARDSTGPATKGAAENLDHVAVAAEGAAKATDNLGEQAGQAIEPVERFGKSQRTAAEHAVELDHEIKNVERELKQLAVAFAEAETAADRADLSKAIRRTQSDLRNLNRSKNLIDDLVPTQQAARNVDELKTHIDRLKASFLAAGTVEGRSFFSKAISEAEGELKNLEGFAKDLGPKIGEQLGAGISVMGPVLAGVGIAAAPLIGATISAAVIGASGVGGVVGGLLLAKKDIRVQAAAKELSGFIGDELNKAAGPFVPATLAGIDQIRGAFSHMSGDFTSIFASASRYVSPLISGVTGLVENVLHGVANAVDKAGPVIDVLRQDLPALGKTIGDVLTELSKDAPSAAAALDQLLNVVGAGVIVLGGWIDILTKTYGILASTGVLGLQAQANWIAYTEQAKIAAASSDTLANSQKGLAIQTKSAADATAAQTKAIQDLDKAERARVDPLFHLLDAQNKVTAAQKAYNDAVKQHGKDSDQARTAARQLAEAALDEGDAVDKVSASMDGKLTPAMQRTLEKAGLTKSQIKAVGEEMDRARGAATKFGQLTPVAHIFADTSGANGPIQHTAALIAGLPRSKHIAITVSESIAGAALDLAAILGHRAGGGPVKKGHAYVVGEKRPELFVPDRDGTILPSVDQISGGAGSARGGGSRALVVEQRATLEFAGNVDSVMAQALIQLVRINPGVRTSMVKALGLG